MARYDVQLKPSAAKSLEKAPATMQKRIVRALEALADEPRPPRVVKLSGDANLWRIRLGAYRVVYEIHDRPPRVIVLRVARRDDVYRKGR